MAFGGALEVKSSHRIADDVVCTSSFDCHRKKNDVRKYDSEIGMGGTIQCKMCALGPNSTMG